MELHFQRETRETWRECLHKEEIFPVELEGVVPDVNDDVGRVASVCSTVLLKSKELESRILSIGGTVDTVVLYITENADRVSSVHLCREFTRTIELPDAETPQEAQATLRALRTETRILNPRKLSVCVEISCEFSLFSREEMTVSLLPSEEDSALIYGLEETADAQAITAVSEKSFALTESFVFPKGKAQPQQILSSELRFHLAEHSRIGSRLIVKGTMELHVSYAADSVCYPLQQSFSTPVSQILDPGISDAVCCTVSCQPTALYLDLSDGIGGEKTLSCEVHALLQLLCRSSVKLSYLSDAYSGCMPSVSSECTLSAESAGEMEVDRMTASELFSVSEDCADVLAVFTGLSRSDAGLTGEFDVIYRSKSGDLAAVHRQLPFQGDVDSQSARVISTELTKQVIQPEGEGIQAVLEAEVVRQRCIGSERRALSGVAMDEEHPFDLSSFPTVTLVQTGEESLWELARTYHSSVAAIENMNPEDRRGRMLLIPRV